MKKITNLLSITLLSSLLACTGQVVGQNVNLNNNIKPTSTPSPTATITPNVIKPSPSITPTPSPIETPKPKDYSSIVFSLQIEHDKEKPFQETISEAKKTFTSIEQEKEYYFQTSFDNPKNYTNYKINLDYQNIKAFDLTLVYLDGSRDKDFTIEVPESFKNILKIENNSTILGIEAGNAYIKVTSNKNKNVFKFFYVSVSYNDDLDCLCYEQEKTTINGKVVDPSNVPVDGAKVSAKAFATGVTWEEEQLTAGGAFIFRSVPVGAKVLITVTKDGWTTRQRTEVVKSPYTGDPLSNKFDFDGVYAIQDEPEITSLKINTKGSTDTGSIIKPSTANLENSIANLSGIENSNLEVEMTFSEPVRTDDVQNFFRIASQNFAVKNNTNFTIDNNLSGVTWEWSNNDQKVIFRTNQAILANKTGNEAKYMIEFTQAVRDKTDKEARTGKYIRFNPQNIGDFHIFSVKNDETKPKLISITAIDGGSSNDVIELKFSEPMNLINKKVDELSLADPLFPSNKTRQLRVYQTNNTNNNATILGYSSIDNSLNINDFKGVYTISRLSNNKTILPLNLNNVTGNTLVTGSNLITARITGGTVKLEFPSTAFNRGEQIILSLGQTILGKYQELNSSFNIDVETPNISYGTIKDPAGNLISTENSDSNFNTTVNDSQRVTVVQ